MDTKVIDKIDEAICTVCSEIRHFNPDNMSALVESLAKLMLAREQIKKS